MGLLDTLAGIFTGESGVSAFRNRMERFARQLGLGVVWDDDLAPVCALIVNLRGESYTFIVAQTGDTVRLSACSNIKFPPGHLPQDVVSFLVEKNRELKHCDFDCIESRKHSYFTVKSTARWNHLTLDLVQTAIHELVVRIAALDALMVQEGYVR